MAVLESCPKHNMVAYLEKTDGNAEFHEIIDFLTRSSIHYALTVSPVISTTFVEQFWTSAKSQTINNVRYINAKVAGKPVTISEASIRSDLHFDDVDGIDSLNNQAIFDAIQLMGYEGDLTVLTFNKALFLPQWKFLFHTLNHCLSSKSTSWDQIPTNIATASNLSPGPSPTIPIPDPIPEGSGGNLGSQSSGDKSLSGIPTNTECDDLDMDIDDTMDYTLAQDKGKSDKVDEKGESSAQQQSNDRQDEAPDIPKVSTARTKLSTNKFEEGTAEPEPRESTSSAAQKTPTPTPTTFGDDETIAQVLLNMSQAKAVSKEKEKRIDPKAKGKKRIEEDEESDTESEEITEAKKKFDQIAHDEEVARKIQEEWEAEEERKRLNKEEATKTALSNEYEFIQARIEADRLLAERVQEAKRE
ncbi:hypothetical protein Tco_0139813 [Tanacetum coccineum]